MKPAASSLVGTTVRMDDFRNASKSATFCVPGMPKRCRTPRDSSSPQRMSAPVDSLAVPVDRFMMLSDSIYQWLAVLRLWRGLSPFQYSAPGKMLPDPDGTAPNSFPNCPQAGF